MLLCGWEAGLWRHPVTQGAGCLDNCPCWLLSVMTSKDVERKWYGHTGAREEVARLRPDRRTLPEAPTSALSVFSDVSHHAESGCSAWGIHHTPVLLSRVFQATVFPDSLTSREGLPSSVCPGCWALFSLTWVTVSFSLVPFIRLHSLRHKHLLVWPK